MAQRQTSAIRLLQASADDEDESELRILCDGRSVRYITVAQGIFKATDMCFEPTLLQILPKLPESDWNEGYIDRDAATGAPCFTRAAKIDLPGIQGAWHQTTLDYLEVNFGEKLRSGVYEATAANFSSTVVVKFAVFPFEIGYLESECKAYE